MIKPEEYHTCTGIVYVTMDMVRAAHTVKEVDDLQNWMRGQTMGIAHNGEVMIYAWDYEIWLRGGWPLD